MAAQHTNLYLLAIGLPAELWFPQGLPAHSGCSPGAVPAVPWLVVDDGASARRQVHVPSAATVLVALPCAGGFTAGWCCRHWLHAGTAAMGHVPGGVTAEVAVGLGLAPELPGACGSLHRCPCRLLKALHGALEALVVAAQLLQ